MPESSSIKDLFAGTEDLLTPMTLIRRLRSLQHDHLTELERAQEVAMVGMDEFFDTIGRLPREREQKYQRVYADMIYRTSMLLAAIAEGERTQRLSHSALGV